MARKPSAPSEFVIECERCRHRQELPKVPTLTELAKRVSPSAFRPSLPAGAGKVDELRVEYSGFHDMDFAPGEERHTAETLAYSADWSNEYLPRGLGILPEGERFAFDLRFRHDVAPEEARAIVQSIAASLTDDDVARWYGIWDRQAREHAIETRTLSGIDVSCFMVPHSASDAFGAALDSIPDHARARLASYWRDLAAAGGNVSPMPGLIGIDPRFKRTPADFGFPTPTASAFTVNDSLGDAPAHVAHAAGLLTLARALVVAERGVPWYGLEDQRQEAALTAARWGADLPSLGAEPGLVMA